MDRRVLAPVLFIPLVVLSFLGGYMLAPRNTTDTSMQTTTENAIVITPILRIYDENGRLIYEKVGDPPTNNLAHLFFSAIAPRYDTSGAAFVIGVARLDGNSDNLDPDATYGPIDSHTLWVLAGTGTNPPSYSDYTMTGITAGEAKVANYFFDTTTNEWVLQVTGTITFSSSFNVTEVGLAVDYADGTNAIGSPTNYPGDNILIFRDVLPTPVQVNNGDSISVQYEIRFKLP